MWRLINHKIVVLVDFSTLLLRRPDELYDAFLANRNLTAMYTRDYQTSPSETGLNMGINKGFFLFKPKHATKDLFNSLVMGSTFNDTHGWGGSGVSNFNCVAGSRGAITYYYTVLDKGAGQEMDRCLYGNTNQNPSFSGQGSVCRDGSGGYACPDCRNKNISDIFVAMPRDVCGEPWQCHYDDNWDSATKILCEKFHRFWYENRLEFEQKEMETQAVRDGQFHDEIFLGYCHETTYAGYRLMLPDNGECITGETVTSADIVTVPGGGQNQKLEFKSAKFTGNGNVCMSGYITKAAYNTVFNIGIAIDVSASTKATFGETAQDPNNDGRVNTILDAEIAAAIKLIETLIATAGLKNDNVDIGLIKFSHSATYLGRYPPADPQDPTKINPVLLGLLSNLTHFGDTHFDDALDKSVDFFEDRLFEHGTNILYFLSDGNANTCGNADDEECTSENDEQAFRELHFNSELALLDSMDVLRVAIGIGEGSDITAGLGLSKIDSNAIRVLTPDALEAALEFDPIVGTPVGFEVAVNGAPVSGVDVSLLSSGPIGYSFGVIEASGLNRGYGVTTSLRVTVTMDLDGDLGTTNDRYVLSTENNVTGTVASWLEMSSPSASPFAKETSTSPSVSGSPSQVPSRSPTPLY